MSGCMCRVVGAFLGKLPSALEIGVGFFNLLCVQESAAHHIHV